MGLAQLCHAWFVRLSWTFQLVVFQRYWGSQSGSKIVRSNKNTKAARYFKTIHVTKNKKRRWAWDRQKDRASGTMWDDKKAKAAVWLCEIKVKREGTVQDVRI